MAAQVTRVQTQVAIRERRPDLTRLMVQVALVVGTEPPPPVLASAAATRVVWVR